MSSLKLFKQLAGDSFVYGISGIITRFVAVFLVPVYTRIFTPEDYGVISLISNIFALLGILIILGMDNSMARWYYDEEDETSRKISLNTFFWSCLTFALGFAALVVIFREYIASLVLKDAASSFILLIAALNLPLTIFVIFTSNVLRIQRKPVAASVFSIGSALIVILLTIVFVVFARVGIIGVFYAQLCGSIIAAVWTIIIFRKTLSPVYFNAEKWKEMFFFSLPLIPGSIAFWVINLSGVYFIQSMKDTHEVGLYQLGTAVASAMAMITGAMQMALGPFTFSIYKQPNAKLIYSQILIIILGLTCFIGFSITLFAREVLMIVATPPFYAAAPVAGILAFNYIVICLSYIATIGTSIAKNNYMYGAASLVSAGLLVLLNLSLIPVWGKEGAALATLFSQLIVPAAVFWHAQRLYPIPYNFTKAALIFFGCFFGGFALLMFLKQLNLGLFPALAVKILASVILALILFFALRNEFFSTKLLTQEPESGQ